MLSHPRRGSANQPPPEPRLESSTSRRRQSASVASLGSAIVAALLFIGSNSEALTNDDRPFVHPGLLHTQQDFDRMRVKVAQGDQPWTAGWQRLLANRHASPNWKPNPQAIVYRGKRGNNAENYAALFNDVAAAYALALRWKVSGDDAFADKAVEILNAWSSTLTAIGGSSDKFLASGIYGYQLATQPRSCASIRSGARPTSTISGA
jgi:alginate lyase